MERFSTSIERPFENRSEEPNVEASNKRKETHPPQAEASGGGNWIATTSGAGDALPEQSRYAKKRKEHSGLAQARPQSSGAVYRVAPDLEARLDAIPDAMKGRLPSQVVDYVQSRLAAASADEPTAVIQPQFVVVSLALWSEAREAVRGGVANAAKLDRLMKAVDERLGPIPLDDARAAVEAQESSGSSFTNASQQLIPAASTSSSHACSTASALPQTAITSGSTEGIDLLDYEFLPRSTIARVTRMLKSSSCR